jgi:hypothetical protein
MSAVFTAAQNAVIWVYDAAGNVIETYEHKGDEVIKSEVGIKN